MFIQLSNYKINPRAGPSDLSAIGPNAAEFIPQINIWHSVLKRLDLYITVVKLAAHEDRSVMDELRCQEPVKLANTPIPNPSGVTGMLLRIIGLVVKSRFVHQFLDNIGDQLKLYCLECRKHSN